MGAYCTIASSYHPGVILETPTMHSPSSSKDPENSQGKSRLDRELEEILSKDDNIRHLPPPPKACKPRQLKAPSSPTSSINLPPRAMKLLSSPAILALVLAVIALLISDASRLLANILCFAAVACIIWPMLQRFRRPSAAASDTKMWRGRVYEVGKPSSTSTRTPLDSVREWWDSRRSNF
jgi:hypothetical protein